MSTKHTLTEKEFAKGWTHFLNCIDFGKSNLDADVIRFMNEVPAQVVAVLAAAPALLEACKGLMKHIDNGDLVRNIDNDGASDWAIKMLPLIQTLTEAKAAIALAEKEG